MGMLHNAWLNNQTHADDSVISTTYIYIQLRTSFGAHQRLTCEIVHFVQIESEVRAIHWYDACAICVKDLEKKEDEFEETEAAQAAT